jgi:hypothetical protein
MEMDPMGADVGKSDPFLVDPNPSYLEMRGDRYLYVDGGDPFDYSSGLTLDGMPVSFSTIQRLAESGSITHGLDIVTTFVGGVVVIGGARKIAGTIGGEKSDLWDIFSPKVTLWPALQAQQKQSSGGRKEPCLAPNFADLSIGKQWELIQLGARAEQWNALDNDQRLGFFNVTGAIGNAGLSLDGWSVDWAGGGIKQDRTFFSAAAGAVNLLGQVENSKSFSPDIGKGGEHQAYNASFRQSVLHRSLQLSFTPDGSKLDADVDIFNPNLQGGFGIGTIFHIVEVASNKLGKKLTDPHSVAFKYNWECKGGNPL